MIKDTSMQTGGGPERKRGIVGSLLAGPKRLLDSMAEAEARQGLPAWIIVGQFAEIPVRHSPDKWREHLANGVADLEDRGYQVINLAVIPYLNGGTDSFLLHVSKKEK